MVTANFTVAFTPSLPTDPNFGVVYVSDYTFVDTTTASNEIVNRTWDLGDGTFLYDDTTITKSYNFPGIYLVSLTATDINGNISTKTVQVSTEYFQRDKIVFDSLPSHYADPGDFTLQPFRVKINSSQIDQPLVLNLFAANSPSTPYEFVPEHWRFLTPTWRFTDKNYNFITSLSVETTPVYYNNKVAAVSGIAEFYYVDDSTTGDPTVNCPVIITATLETSNFSYPADSNVYPYPAFSNNKFTKVATIWRVNDLLPDTLKVTENYLTDIFPFKWKDVKIPFIISCHKQRDNKLSNILFSYPTSNYYGRLSSVSASLSGTNGCIVDEAPLYFQATDKNNSSTGGFIFTTLTPTSAIDTTFILVSTVANVPFNQPQENEFSFPTGEGANVNVWISNPLQKNLNQILLDVYPTNCDVLNYYKNNSLLYDGSFATITVPNSGTYNIAIDPVNYNAITTDEIDDKLYRYSTTGNALSTYTLSSLGYYNPNKKLFHNWSWTTPVGTTSATPFAFDDSARLSSNTKNYILVAGGLIQPNNIIEINRTLNALQLQIASLSAPSNINIDLIELFDPGLPQHISSLMTWTTASNIATTNFLLTGSPALSSDPNYYIVSVDGVLQRSNTYTVDNTTKILSLCSSAPPNTTVHILYMPSIYPPANWIFTPSTNITSFDYGAIAHPNYRDDSSSQFIVNIGGVLQSLSSYNIDYPNQTINFTETISAGIPVSVTQISVSGDVGYTPEYTPSYISLDKDRNIWISVITSLTAANSFYYNINVLKFDSNFNLITTATPNPNFNFTASLTPYIWPTNKFIASKPPIVETDRDSNIWVTYANTLCSMLVKYDSNGTSLYEVPLPVSSIPVNLAVTKQNNIWVSNSFNTSISAGSLQLYSTTGTLMSTVSGMVRPGYLALDKFNNLWFTYGLREIGLVTTSGIISSWYLSADNDTFVSRSLSAYSLVSDGELGGIATDIYNRVWVIDSLNNKTYVFPASSTITNVRVIDVSPGLNEKSTQATGDWTGNKWYQKYYNIANISAIPLTGISTPFTITDFTNPAQIYRNNENFDAAGHYKSLALPEILNNNTRFFDTFLGAVIGNNVLSAYEDLGQKTYERIANFTLNFADIDTCEVNQLLSLAQQTNTPFVNYNLTLPADIQKYLNLASVSMQKLWGIKTPIPLSSESIGPELNTASAYVTAGTQIYIRNKFDSSYSLYRVPLLSAFSTVPVSAQSVYPLSSMNGVGLIPPFLQNYLFYEYKPVYSDTFIENIIDWTNPNTTLSPYLSTVTDWYGKTGILENVFNYLLTKNLLAK